VRWEILVFRTSTFSEVVPKAGKKLRTFRLQLNSSLATCVALAGLICAPGARVLSQQPVSADDSPKQTVKATVDTAAQKPDALKEDDTKGGITEEELKRMLVGKQLMLRGAYMADSLSYNEHGKLIGNSKPASFTLCAVQIDKVQLSKRKLVLIGSRYGLHFLGALANEDPAKGMDLGKITPKKKVLKITIDRELVVKPKKVKEPKHSKHKQDADDSATDENAAASMTPDEIAEQAKTEASTEKPAEKPEDPDSVTTTTSPAHSAALLRAALDDVFADSIDARMIAAMPDFWKLYYQAAAAKTDYRPADSSVLRQNMVDQKAKLLSKFEPASNEWAQARGVAGMSLYHVVLGADGTPGEIAVARPIGFGLDENAVEAIRNAKFEPAIKDGKPVPVMLDLVVQFRIYSKRTAVGGATQANDKPQDPVLPGPYSAQQQN
jgi:TonB family protein